MQTKKELERQYGIGSPKAHNQAYVDCGYERRFKERTQTNQVALEKLKAIGEPSKHEDVFLVCYEEIAKACHRSILLRIAEETLGAEVLVEGAEP